MNNDRWDVIGKSPGGESESIGVRLQALLGDRFQLKVHREQKVMPAYSLVFVKSKLQPAAEPDTRGYMQRGIGHLKGKNVDMRFLCVWLARFVDRVVVDETGLPGGYDFELNWSPEVRPSATPTENPPQGPDIFTAVQEQLGLKMQSRKEPIEIIVIDHAEKASAN
jgi:uncharacterized protein (TIGR03435 family)